MNISIEENKQKKSRSPKAKTHKYKVTLTKDKKKAISLYKKSGYIVIKETEDKITLEKKIISTEDYVEDEDYQDMLDWLLIQANEVKENCKIVSSKDLQQDYQLHIDKNVPPCFIPKFPQSASSSENDTSARITVAPTLVGCIIGYFRIINDFMHGSTYKDDPYKGGYIISELPFTHCIKPNNKLVFDSDKSDEHWLVSYSEKTIEYKPSEVGKVFVSNVVLTGKNGKDPSTNLTLYIYHNKQLGIKFSNNILLAPGYYKVDVFYETQSLFTVDKESNFKVSKITQEDYEKNKQLSAALLSHSDTPKFCHW